MNKDFDPVKLSGDYARMMTERAVTKTNSEKWAELMQVVDELRADFA